MQKIAFKIANELLNRDFINEDVWPSQLETVILQVLTANLSASMIGKKTHFDKRLFLDGDYAAGLCGCEVDEIRLTTVEDEVTCKNCLNSIKIRRVGRGYTLC